VAATAGWTTRISIGRPLATVTAVIAVFAMLLGGAVWLSKKALPGDVLYSLKRANENVQLSTTGGDTAKGRLYLSQASTRADEVAALLTRSSAIAAGAGPTAAGTINAHTAKLVTSTLGVADSDVRNAAQLLAREAVRSGSADPLSIMTEWAPAQIQRLQRITERLGSGATHDRAAASAKLAGAMLVRAEQLKAELSTSTATKGRNVPVQPKVTGATDPGVSVPGTLPTEPSSVPVPPVDDSATVTVPSVPVTLPTLPTLLPPSTSTSSSTVQHSCTVYIIGICIP